MANKNAYIPPQIQKQMTQNLERNLPQNLKKYQNDRGLVPRHAESAIAEQLQKNLPAHMQQYVEPYMHQNVLYGSPPSGGGARANAARPMPTRTPQFNTRQRSRSFSKNPSSMAAANGQTQTQNNSTSPYDFILNPDKPSRVPLIGGPNSKLLKGLVALGGLVLLVTVIIVGSSFFNSANNAQKQRLLEVAQTQSEIVRIAEATNSKTKDSRVTQIAATALISTRSSLDDTTSLLKARGGNTKGISASKNPTNDQELAQGEANSSFDKVYLDLLYRQLNDYQILINSASAAATPSEQQVLTELLDQSNLLKNDIQKLTQPSSQ